MQSEHPHSQGGAHPAFQHQSNINALTSPQDKNVAPLPDVHPANGIQHSMVATPYLGELGVAYSPAQWQQGNTQSQQNFQGLYQLKSKGIRASTRFQHPKPFDSACSPLNGQHQISRKANAHFYSSAANVSAQHSIYFGTSANENSVRRSVYNGGQEREFSKQKGSYLNINTGLQQRQHLNFAFSVGTSSSALQGDNFGAKAQAFSSQDQCSSVPESKQKRSCQLLRALLKDNPPDFQFFMTTPLSEETSATNESNTSTPFSDERHYKSKQTIRSQAALYCGKTRRHNLDQSGINHSTSCQQEVSSPSLSSQPSTKKVSQVGEMVPLTDDPIQELIAQEVAYYRTILTKKKESQSLTCAVTEEGPTAVGQALEEHSSRGSKANAELTSMSDKTGDGATSASKNHSTEYLQIMEKVAATCTKNEDESPVVLTAVSKMTLDEPTEKHPRSSHNCRSSQEEYKSLGFSISKNLDNIAKKHTTQKGDTCLKPEEEVGMDNVQCVTNISEDLQTKSSSVVSENKAFEPTSLVLSCKEVIAHSKLNSSPDIQIQSVVSISSNKIKRLWSQASCEGLRKDVGFLYSQTDVRRTLSENKVKEQAPLSESEGNKAHSVTVLKDPQYEDISDNEDMSELATQLPNTEHEEISFSACSEDQQYKNISEDENPQIENMTVDRSSLKEVPEPKNRLSPFENEGYRHVQGQAEMKTKIISDELIPTKLVSIEAETEAEDQIDDDWIVIPISMSDLRFEQEDDQDNTEQVDTGDKETQRDKSPTHCELYWPAPPPASQIEVYDTPESFLKAMGVQIPNATSTDLMQLEMGSGWHTEEHEVDSEGQLHSPRNRREAYSDPEDSCETEDSCDYSSGSEHNLLTVSRRVLTERSAPLPSETDDSMSEKEGEDDEVTNVQKGHTRSLDKLNYLQKLRGLIEAKAATNHDQHKTNGQKSLGKNDIITIDSGTEDESDQICKKRAERKRLSSLGSDNPCSQQKKHLTETVGSSFGTCKKKFKKSRWPSADSPAPQHLSTPNDTQFKGLMQYAWSDLTHSTEKSGQHMETKGGIEHVQHNGQRIPNEEGVIMIVSDTEDDSGHNCKKVSSGSAEGDDAPCVPHKIHSPKTVNNVYGTENEKLRETRLSSSDSSLPHHLSTLYDTQFTAMQDECSYLLHSTEKSGQLIKAKVGLEHVQHDANRKRNTKRQLSSGPEGSDDALFARKNRHSTESEDHLHGSASKKMKKPRLSNEGFTKKQPQSADKEAHSTSGRNPVISRLIVSESSKPTKYLKLVKDSRVYMQSTDETLARKTSTGTIKKTASRDRDTQHSTRNKDGRIVSKPSSASSRGSLQSGETSTTCIHPKSKQCICIPIQHLSLTKRQLSRSWSSPPTLDHPRTPTKGQSSAATMQSSAREQVTKDRKNSFFRTRKDRKRNLMLDEDKRTTNNDLYSEARPGLSHSDRALRQRYNSHMTETPLMKKTKSDAREWTKARNWDTARKQRYSVGDGYKWSEKPKVAKSAKGSARQEEK